VVGATGGHCQKHAEKAWLIYCARHLFISLCHLYTVRGSAITSRLLICCWTVEGHHNNQNRCLTCVHCLAVYTLIGIKEYSS
jgi:hypothetical protein